MKYSSSNKPLVCMQTQSVCYKNTRKMTINGILWHSTGANNPNLKRYIQPSDNKPAEDTYSKEEWLQILGKNPYKNDWNHSDREAGLNCWIGKLADGSVATVQTMPWDYRPWGCGSGKNGSCNNGWIQFEICEDGLTDKAYFDKVYKEACEITAYLCDMFDIDPKGTVEVNGVKVPTILCHQDSYKLGMGNNHGDIYHWFPKFGKNMETAREDVAALLKTAGVTKTESQLYRVRKSKDDSKSQAGAFKLLEGAKSACQAAGEGYHVFDWNWQIVYSYVAPVTLSRIALMQQPNKRVYLVGEAFDSTGLVIAASYSDKSVQIITDYELTGFTSAKAGKISITVKYKDMTTTFPITIKEPEVVIPPTVSEPTAVYDLKYPEMVKIIEKTIKRTDTDCVKAIKKILYYNKDFDIEIAKVFFKLAPLYGIDPLKAMAQSILETGWFKYVGSAVTSEQHNYCGLGVTNNGKSGASFNTIEDGVTAQLQHLFAYACEEPLPANTIITDPRFTLVSRGIAPCWQQLAGRWACPGYDSKVYDTPEEAMKAGNTYGQKILALFRELLAVVVSEDEVKNYFSVTDSAPVEDDNTLEDKVSVNRPSIENSDISSETDSSDENDTSSDTSNSDDFDLSEDSSGPDSPPDSKDTQNNASTKNIIKIILNCLNKLIQFIINKFNRGE